LLCSLIKLRNLRHTNIMFFKSYVEVMESKTRHNTSSEKHEIGETNNIFAISQCTTQYLRIFNKFRCWCWWGCRYYGHSSHSTGPKELREPTKKYKQWSCQVDRLRLSAQSRDSRK
jgi:hypothetical protein